MKKNLTQNEHTIVERKGQLQFALNTEIMIPKEATVRLTDAQLEELDYRKRYKAFSLKGRNPVTDPRVLFKVLAYANQLHIYSNRQIEDYRCADCTSCARRAECCKAVDPDKPKELRVRKQYEQKRAASEANIISNESVYLRICRSIQVEGAFGLLKNDFGFRRFLTRGKKNVRTELFLLGLGFNLKKRWKKEQNGRLQTHLSVLDSA